MCLKTNPLLILPLLFGLLAGCGGGGSDSTDSTGNTGNTGSGGSSLTVEAGNDRTVGPGRVELKGKVTGAEGTVTYLWTSTSTPPGVSVTLNGDDTLTPSFSAPGRAVTLTFTLTVTDAAGNKTTDTVTITVDPNRPTVDAGDDQTVPVGQTVTLDGSGASNKGGSVTYLWSQDPGNPATLTLSSNTDAAPTFTPPATTGTYTLILTVTDSVTGLSSEDRVTIIVDATDPTAKAGTAPDR